MNCNVSLVFIMSLVVTMLFSGCGADWDQSVKEGILVKNYMKRDIKIINSVTGETLKHFRAKSYISDESTNGDVTITYYDAEGQLQKLDILGNMAIVITDTKCESDFPKK